MNLLHTLRGQAVAADTTSFGVDDWLRMFEYGAANFPVINQTLDGGKQAEILPDLIGFSEGAFKRNGIIFACIVTRMQLFSQVRFKFRPKRSYSSGELFGASSLELFEKPWPKGSTSQLLKRMSIHADVAGNAYIYREGNVLRIARPDWMTIVLGTARKDGKVGDIDTEIIGYVYRPPLCEPRVFLSEEIAHFAPIPDPALPVKGISWLQPIVTEIMADNATAKHKLKFFENGATANMVVTLNQITDPEKFKMWVELFKAGHRGVDKAYETLFLANGADAKVVGSNLEQIDFKVTQAHGETRMAIAARIPPIVLGISEGLDTSSYRIYEQARRHFADSEMRPLWGDACAALAPLIEAPNGSELWYDDRMVPWLAVDQKEVAATQALQAATVSSYVMAGFDPASVVEALQSGDLTKLSHSGLYSVQLHPPGSDAAPPTPPAGAKADVSDEPTINVKQVMEAVIQDAVRGSRYLPAGPSGPAGYLE